MATVEQQVSEQTPNGRGRRLGGRGCGHTRREPGDRGDRRDGRRTSAPTRSPRWRARPRRAAGVGGLRLRGSRAGALARAEVADGQRRAGDRDDRLGDRQDLGGRGARGDRLRRQRLRLLGQGGSAPTSPTSKVKSSQVLVKGKRLVLRYQPLGLIGVIGPWNYPLTNSFGDCIPALAAGNSVILKPSEITPLTSLLMAEGLRECGLPENVLQIATGRGETGAALVEQVDMIMFTGSTRTGTKVAEAAARRLIPASLELGGKDPMIVLSDADLERAANFAAVLLDAERGTDLHLDRARLRGGARLRRVRRESHREGARAAGRQARRLRLGRGRRDHVPAADGDDQGPRRRRRAEGRARRSTGGNEVRARAASSSRPCWSTWTTR